MRPERGYAHLLRLGNPFTEADVLPPVVVLHKLLKRVAVPRKILRVHRGGAAPVSVGADQRSILCVFSYLCEVAKRKPRPALRFGVCDAGLRLFFGFEFDMRFRFSVKFVIVVSALHTKFLEERKAPHSWQR